jgi:hypothetical protein
MGTQICQACLPAVRAGFACALPACLCAHLILLHMLPLAVAPNSGVVLLLSDQAMKNTVTLASCALPLPAVHSCCPLPAHDSMYLRITHAASSEGPRSLTNDHLLPVHAGVPESSASAVH